MNYGISKSSNEYCGTLSNGFVLNYRMDIMYSKWSNGFELKNQKILAKLSNRKWHNLSNT